MENRYSLILTGQALPGFAPENVWPKLAAYVRMEPERLAQLLARAPITIKQDADQGKLNAWQAGIAQTGAQSEIFPPDERPALFVLVDGAPRGPMPRALAEQRVRQGAWADSISVTESGSGPWQPYSELAAAAAAPSLQISTPPPAAPPPQPAAGQTPGSVPAAVWAAPASMQNPAAQPGPAQGAPGAELPPGEAIHAGFWWRNAALTLDFLIIIIPTLVAGIIPFGGIVAHWLYYALMDSSPQQNTLGKRAMGIKVVDKYGRRLTFGAATWRFFSEVVVQLVVFMVLAVIFMAVFVGDMVAHEGTPSPDSLITMGIIFIPITIAWFVTYMMIGWTERKQSLYDKMAGTLIVFDEVEPGQPLPTERPRMPWYGWALNIAPYVVCLALIGILTPVALPWYQKLTAEGKGDGIVSGVMTAAIVSTAIDATGPVRQKIARDGCTPESLAPPSDLIEKMEVDHGASGQCAITLTFAQSDKVPQALHNQQVELTVDGTGSWACSSPGLPEKVLPVSCRRSSENEND